MKAGYEKIMREGVPVPPVEDPVAQMQADRAASRAPVKEGPAFFFFLIMQKVTDIDCEQSDKKQQQKQKVRVKWRERNGEASRNELR